jgi:hypothetical protein
VDRAGISVDVVPDNAALLLVSPLTPAQQNSITRLWKRLVALQGI